MRHVLLTLFVALAAIAPASARDTTLHLDAKDVLDPSYSKGKLDGSVRFYFAGQPTPDVLSELGAGTTRRKTNAVGRSDTDACKWVMLTAMLALQEQAKSRGANAVVGITSAQAFAKQTQYECRAGALMAGVSLRGRYVRIAGR